MIFGIKGKLIIEIDLCDLRLVLWSRVTYVLWKCQFFFIAYWTVMIMWTVRLATCLACNISDCVHFLLLFYITIKRNALGSFCINFHMCASEGHLCRSSTGFSESWVTYVLGKCLILFITHWTVMIMWTVKLAACLACNISDCSFQHESCVMSIAFLKR